METILEWSTFMVDGHHIYLSLLESVNWGWVNYNKAFREYIHIAIDVVWCFFPGTHRTEGPHFAGVTHTQVVMCQVDF